MIDGLYLMTTRYASAGVIVRDNIIHATAPIYLKFIGQSVDRLPIGYARFELAKQEERHHA